MRLIVAPAGMVARLPTTVMPVLRRSGHFRVYVGQSTDTPTFAVANIAHWCASERLQRFPQATELLIQANSGGSNAARSRVWKQQLQEKVADRFGLTVTVCHYPTGASKWNPVEHRLFSEISKTWAGCPLRTFDLALDYIRQIRTQTGLRVQAHLVTDHYATGVRVTDYQMDALNLQQQRSVPVELHHAPTDRPPPELMREVIFLRAPNTTTTNNHVQRSWSAAMIWITRRLAAWACLARSLPRWVACSHSQSSSFVHMRRGSSSRKTRVS